MIVQHWRLGCNIPSKAERVAHYRAQVRRDDHEHIRREIRGLAVMREVLDPRRPIPRHRALTVPIQ